MGQRNVLRVAGTVAVLAAIGVAKTWYGTADFDFRAFLCAGRALDDHADPYRFGYLARCQDQLHAIPAPLPGYDLSAFAVLAHLPFVWANALFLIASTASVGIATVCLQRLTRLPAVLIAATLFVSDFFLSIEKGQLASFAVAALSLAALLAHERKPRLAAVAALVSLIEPHVGLGVCVTFAIAVPAARRTMAAGGLFLGLLSLVAEGPALALEYVAQVIPRHAASEIAHRGQLSLTHVMHLLGSSDDAALVAGSLSFAVTLALGAFVGLRLSRDTGDAAFAIVSPAALGLIGGTYIHGTQMCLALPAALLAYASFPSRRPQLAVAIALLAIPWSEPVQSSTELIATAAVVAAIAYILSEKNPVTASCAGAASSLASTVAAYLASQARVDTIHAFRPTTGANDFVDDEWRQFVELAFSDHQTAWIVLISLTWIGLGLLAYALIGIALERRRFAP